MLFALLLFGNCVFSADHIISPFIQSMRLCQQTATMADNFKELPFIDEPSKVLTNDEIQVYFMNNFRLLLPVSGKFRDLNNLIVESDSFTMDERKALNKELMNIKNKYHYIDQYLYINQIILQKRHDDDFDIISDAKKVSESMILVAKQAIYNNEVNMREIDKFTQSTSL